MTTHDQGWWVIAGERLQALLQRAADGEDPGLIYAEEYANSRVENPADDHSTVCDPECPCPCHFAETEETP